MSAGKKLRELLRRKKFSVTPGITTPLHAMIVEKAGFDFVYTGGYDVSLTLLGYPDVGLMTAVEMLTNARNIAQATCLPVVADIDTGYGNAINTIRTVRDFEAAGLAAVHIEDQIFPKPAGHVGARAVLLPVEEVVGKLKAALDARRDKDFMIMARTHATSAPGGGVEEAVRRAKAFARAGCDAVWSDIPNADIAVARTFAREVRRDFPEISLYLDYSAAYGVPFHEFADMGYNMMHTPLAGLRATIMATWDYLVDFKARGAQAEIDFQERLAQHPMGTYHRTGFAEIREMEARYLPADEVQKRYDGALGH